MVERLDRLRLHSVVGCDDEHCDVGDLGTTSTHGGERLVTRGVDEGQQTLAGPRRSGVELVGTEVPGDATRPPLPNRGVAGGDRQAWLTRERRGQAMGIAYVGGALALALVGSAWCVSTAPLSHGRLEQVLDRVPNAVLVPIGTNHAGHGWCRPRCPTVTRT